MPDNVLKYQYFLQLTPEEMPKYKNCPQLTPERVTKYQLLTTEMTKTFKVNPTKQCQKIT